MIKEIQELILTIREGVVVDFVGGVFIVENKNLVEGKPTKHKIQGVGLSLDLALENFLDSWKASQKQSAKDKLDIDDFRWYSSH